MSGSCDYWNKEKENLSFSYIRDQDVNKKMVDARSEACSESPSEQASPFLPATECPVLWLFVLADVSLCQASSSFLSSFLLSSKHSFKPSRSLICRLFYPGFLSGGSFADTSRNVKSASIWLGGVFAGDLCFVKALSAFSWNDLGAKLIAPDPTSRCNQLSANLGFSEQPSLVWATLLQRAVHCSLLPGFWPLALSFSLIVKLLGGFFLYAFHSQSARPIYLFIRSHDCFRSPSKSCLPTNWTTWTYFSMS